jgi:hypothetical protein
MRGYLSLGYSAPRVRSDGSMTAGYSIRVRWSGSHFRTLLLLAGQDTWQLEGARVMTGLQVNAIALVIAVVATGRLVALWTIAAYPVLVAGTYTSYLIRRIRGWNSLWKRDTSIASLPAGGRRLTLSLDTKERHGLRPGLEMEYTCEVRDPGGQEYKADASGGPVRVSCYYPDSFGDVPALMPGTYEVTWRERKRAGPGKWRVMDTYRVEIP